MEVTNRCEHYLGTWQLDFLIVATRLWGVFPHFNVVVAPLKCNDICVENGSVPYFDCTLTPMHMKKIQAFLLLIIVSFCSMSFVHVTVPFEGTVHYETSLSGEIPDALAERIAKYYDVRFKGTDLKITGEGPLKAEVLTKKSLGKVFIIRRDQKNIYELDMNDNRLPADTSAPTVTRAKESFTIAGYVCQQYQIQFKNDMMIKVWTTFSIQETDWGTGLFGGHFKLPSAVEGFPLKFEFVFPKFSITGTATVVKYLSLNEAEFAIPSGLSSKKL